MSITRSLLLLFFASVQSAAWAQPEPLGRLFFTPEQRAALDRQRQFNLNFLTNQTDADGSLTLNGEVRRSSGRNTRWVNGEAQWNGNVPSARVPVGDTFNPRTGERESVLGEGRIIVRRPPPTP